VALPGEDTLEVAAEHASSPCRLYSIITAGIRTRRPESGRRGRNPATLLTVSPFVRARLTSLARFATLALKSVRAPDRIRWVSRELTGPKPAMPRLLTTVGHTHSHGRAERRERLPTVWPAWSLQKRRPWRPAAIHLPVASPSPSSSTKGSQGLPAGRCRLAAINPLGTRRIHSCIARSTMACRTSSRKRQSLEPAIPRSSKRSFASCWAARSWAADSPGSSARPANRSTCLRSVANPELAQAVGIGAPRT